jgi:hypothetical protein
LRHPSGTFLRRSSRSLTAGEAAGRVVPLADACSWGQHL